MSSTESKVHNTTNIAKVKAVKATHPLKPAKPIEVAAEPEIPKLHGCERVLECIWPIRFKRRMPADSGELYIKTTLRNLFLYIIFLVVVCIIVYGMIGLINFYFTNGMLSLYIDQKINETDPWPVTFRNGFIEFTDVWEFLGGPLLQGLYFETWYDLNPTAANSLGYIFYTNKLLGSARLLQLRVKDNSCQMSGEFASLIPSCIGTYNENTHSENPFGKALINGGLPSSDLTYTAWYYNVDPKGGSSYSGLVSTYPSTGYTMDLPEMLINATAVINDLQSNNWIDKFTRAIIIDFTVYNGNVNLFNQIRLVMEFPASGGVLNSWTVRTSKLLRYVSSFDYFVAACECLYVLFIIYYTIEEILEICYHKCKYFKNPYNLMDWIILGLSYTAIIFNIYRTIAVNNLLDHFLVNNSTFENFDSLTYVQELFNQISAIVVFFAWIKLFKYISLNKTIDQLSSTLKRSAKDVLYFCIIFFIVFFAYSALGYFLFGESLQDYKDFFTTLFTLFRIILGDFDFISLRNGYPVLGPIYFMTFVFIGFFILLNMFMAIINQSYQKVKAEMESSQPEFMLSDYLKMNYGRVVDKLNLRRNRIMDIEEILKSEEISTKDELDYDVFRREMRKKGYIDMEIEAIFSKYDRDCDRKLNELEKIHLVREIARARSHLSDEFKNFKQSGSTATANDGFEVGDETAESDDETKKMSRDDFDFVVNRIDRLELSVASIIKKIDKLFGHLENMELDKIKKRQEIARLMGDQNSNSEMDLDDLID